VWVEGPFSISDLKVWKEMASVYREDPEQAVKVMEVVETMVRTQDPAWNDLQVVLDNFLDSTEKQMVLEVAKTQAEAAGAHGILTGAIEQNFPSGDPQWHPNVVDHRLTRYQRWVLYGVRHAMPKAMNWSKLYEVRQDKHESPLVFL
ncbi:hypothetical protein N328_05973, partial [Gavia stellata]